MADKGGKGSKVVIVVKDQKNNCSWTICMLIGQFEAYFGDSAKQPNDSYGNHGG